MAGAFLVSLLRSEPVGGPEYGGSVADLADHSLSLRRSVCSQQHSGRRARYHRRTTNSPALLARKWSCRALCVRWTSRTPALPPCQHFGLDWIKYPVRCGAQRRSFCVMVYLTDTSEASPEQQRGRVGSSDPRLGPCLGARLNRGQANQLADY